MMFRTLSAALLAATGAMAGDRALVIGIDDYTAVAGAPILNGAVADTGLAEKVLTGPLGFRPEEIVRLTDAAASYDAILTALIDILVKETAPGDRAVFYFAGHGTVLPDGSPALLAHDGDTVLGRIPLTTISDILDLISDREVTVILDAGFESGPPGTRGVSGALAELPVAMGEGTALWVAAGDGQLAWEDIDRGVFTGAWADALLSGQGDADGDGSLTQLELSELLTARLADWCDASPPCAASGRGLTPVVSGGGNRTVLTLEVPKVREDQIAPIVVDDGAPASFRETLGFVTDLFAPSNDAGLTLSVRGGATLRVGDFVTFTASADRPGTLLLLDVDPEGRLAQVYPSALAPDGGTSLSPGQSLTIPNAVGASGKPLRIRVTEPAGQGLLLGLFIEGDLPQLTALLPAGLAGGPVPNASQSLFEISQSLLRLEADPDRPVAWSATYLPYRIEP